MSRSQSFWGDPSLRFVLAVVLWVCFAFVGLDIFGHLHSVAVSRGQSVRVVPFYFGCFVAILSPLGGFALRRRMLRNAENFRQLLIAFLLGCLVGLGLFLCGTLVSVLSIKWV